FLGSGRLLPRTANTKYRDHLAAHYEQGSVRAASPKSEQKVPELLADERILVSVPAGEGEQLEARERFLGLGRESRCLPRRSFSEPAEHAIKVAVGRL